MPLKWLLASPDSAAKRSCDQFFARRRELALFDGDVAKLVEQHPTCTKEVFADMAASVGGITTLLKDLSAAEAPACMLASN